MTNEKAREFFSAYSEGTLDAGLAQSFEAKLRADATLRAEYEQFESTLKELEALRFEKIEVPFDINDRIGAAIDKSIYDKKRTAQPGWTHWLRNVAFAGLAAAAVFGAYLGINATAQKGGVSESGVTGPSPSNPAPKKVEQIEYMATKKGVNMHYWPSEPHTVTIRGGSDGDQVKEVGKSDWYNDLQNTQPSAAVFTVEVKGEIPPAMVIVPGTERKDISAGQGSLVDLAKAIADKYGVPVILKSTKAQSEISWNLTGTDAHKTVAEALQGLPYTPYLQENILYISDN